MSLFFSRNTKVYLGGYGSQFFEIPVLEGFSFSQSVNSQEITSNEAVSSLGKTKRSKKIINTSLAPAEWSFSTYIRPFKSLTATSNGWETGGPNGRVHAVEEALWAAFISNEGRTLATATNTSKWGGSINKAGATSSEFNFTGSEVSHLKTFDLYFVMNDTLNDLTPKVYKLSDCVVNEASIDFDIDGIATINWAGFGSKIEDEGTSVPYTNSNLVNEGTTSTDNFIRNRLTSCLLYPNTSTQGDLHLTLTGGNVTFSNNISYLTPEKVGVVNKPITHVTGARSVSGNLTCYLDAGSYNIGNNVASLFNDARLTDSTEHRYGLDLQIGGTAGNTPRLELNFSNCHLNYPTHSMEDVISVDIEFNALAGGLNPTLDEESTGTGTANINNMEAVITYRA